MSNWVRRVEVLPLRRGRSLDERIGMKRFASKEKEIWLCSLMELV